MPPLYRVTGYALSDLVEDIKVGRIEPPRRDAAHPYGTGPSRHR